jgi:Putative undecaprenyl diphosphate synthase
MFEANARTCEALAIPAPQAVQVRAAGAAGVKQLTVFALSAENWDRGTAEVSSLLAIMEAALRSDLRDLVANNVQVTFFGELHRLPRTFQALIDRCAPRWTALQAVKWLNCDRQAHVAISSSVACTWAQAKRIAACMVCCFDDT